MGSAFNRGLIGASLLLLPLLLATPAAAAECTAPEGSTAVTIKVEPKPLAYDTKQGLKALTQKMRPNENLAQNSIYSLGLTSVEWSSQAQIELSGRPIKGGSYCWHVASIKMTVKADMVILIASEIVRDTCSWREVMKHERKHVSLYQKIFGWLPGEIRPKILAAAKGAVATPDGEQALALFQKKGEAAITKTLGDFANRITDRQRREIDTKAEYDRVDAACADAEWDAIFARAGLR